MMLGLNNLNSNNKMSQNPQTENEMKFGESQVPSRTSNVSAMALHNNLNQPFPGISGKNSDLVVKTVPYIKTVEWEMLDKRKFFPLSMLSSFTVRCFLYPLTLIRTRLQVQKGKEVYTGTFDAGRKIVQSEGVRGLYRGFLVSTVQIVSGLCYVSMYEWSRHVLEEHNVTNKTKAFISGGLASIATETFAVPLDVISQHMMLMGLAEKQTKNRYTLNLQSHQANKIPLSMKDDNLKIASKFTKSTVPQFVTDHSQNIQSAAQSLSTPDGTRTIKGASKRKTAQDVVIAIYKRDGIKGYYRGYTASVCMYAPSSASWWTFYQFYQDKYDALITSQNVLLPNHVVKTAAAMSSSCTTSIITNPLDLVRVRHQVQSTTFKQTISHLWHQEGLRIFIKGLPTRMMMSIIYSTTAMFFYENVKKLSVYREYKDKIVW